MFSQYYVKRIGYSGRMLPVMEDSLLARRWSEGTFDVDGILARQNLEQW